MVDQDPKTSPDWRRHANKFADRITDILAGIFGAAIYHFLTEKKDKSGKVVVDKDGKPVMTLDPGKVRAHVPYFILNRADEGEFNALVANLDSGSQKNLEFQMGPAELGKNQRSDVILNVVQSNERNPPLFVGGDTRIDTMKVLQALADITDPVQWKRRAVAFRLMKENESDYLGTKVSEQASAALVYLIGEFRQGKTEWDDWADARTVDMDNWTAGMRTQLRATRLRVPRPRGFFTTLRRMFDLPWQSS
ncbi:MAG: hypothetical protein ABI643_03565 [Candidatus Doudnabacteria bacterium]